MDLFEYMLTLINDILPKYISFYHNLMPNDVTAAAMSVVGLSGVVLTLKGIRRWTV